MFYLLIMIREAFQKSEKFGIFRMFPKITEMQKIGGFPKLHKLEQEKNKKKSLQVGRYM